MMLVFALCCFWRILHLEIGGFPTVCVVKVIFDDPEVHNDAEKTTENVTVKVFEMIRNENEGSSQLLREGDIAVKPGRSATSCAANSCAWPKNNAGIVNVPYTLSSYSDSDAAIITQAMLDYIPMTCIRFVPRTTETNYLNISPKNGCWSYIGRLGGAQDVSLDYLCMTKGTIQHELNHAIGFEHEQNRSDRDDYVQVLLQYINSANWLNFAKANTNNLGLEYDYSSVMHYDKFAYSNTSNQATIIPTKDPAAQIGQRKGMSNLDVAKINKLYNCGLCSTINSFGFGFMNSTNYPSQYPNNINCSYLMRSTGYKILLTFNAFDIETSQGCESDYVTIYDGITNDSPILLNKACGSRIMPPMLSSSNALLMQFVTNGDVTASGFSAYFENVVCAHTYTDQSGIVTSENYPDNYPPSLECSYYLWAPARTKISLTFNDFDLEPMPNYCRLDYILIYDGPSSKSSLIGRFCGTDPVQSIVSSSNNLLITFHSDKMNQRKGFSASFTRVSG